MTYLTDDIASILQTVSRPGDFHASGTFDLLPPGIEIDGFGPLALPILPDQAERLIASAELAPFGRGTETIVDPKVRCSWQISPERIRFASKRWAATLEAVVARAAEGLGVGERVEAEFYKLLVYDVGGFFVSHRDTEKSPGMFATMVIALPSRSTGGALVVRHAGREASIDLHCDDPAEARFAAFYADCVHEVRPVESGCRLTLVYNLVRRGAGKAPEPPRYDREEKMLVARLRDWPRDDAGSRGCTPSKIVYPLAHAYTPAELSFASLKGADAAAAGVLAHAAAQAGCDLHLALLTIEQTGSAEYSYQGRSGRGRWSEPSDDEYEMGEMYEHSETLSEWRRPDGGSSDFGEMPVAEDEFSPASAVEDMVPDDQEFREATGNEGATLERSYRRAALVLWPTAAFLPMVAANGLGVSLPYLANIVERWRAGAGDMRSRLAEEARALADAMIPGWPFARGYRSESRPSSATTFLDLLIEIDAAPLIERFLRRGEAGQDLTTADNPAAIRALSLLSPGARVEAIEHLIGDAAPRFLAGSADLLRRAATAWRDLPARELRAAADRLLAFLPRDASGPSDHRRSEPDANLVVDIVGATSLVDPKLGVRAVEAMLSAPKTFGMDGCLVPALRGSLREPAISTTPAVARLRAACIEHLQTRVALPLAPPADFRRASQLTCSCQHCSPLREFLADPARQSWTLRAAQDIRGHVESTIRYSNSDLDMTTVRKGSPHSLVVAKNQASYERLAQQRREDIANLAKIERAGHR